MDQLINKILDELFKAQAQYPQFHSAHEGLAVILEEVDELKSHVWTKPDGRDIVGMGQEAIQIAAMAMRFYIDCVVGKTKGDL